MRYLDAREQANSHLVHLDLSQNLIAETGGVHLGRALGKTACIHSFHHYATEQSR